MTTLFRLLVATGMCALSLPLLASADETLSFGHASPAAQATRTEQVTLGDIYLQPKVLQVKAGETVRFVLTNKGQLLHEFNLGSASMHAEHQKEMREMQENGMLLPTGVNHDAMDHGSMMGGAMKHDDPNSVLVEPGKTAELTWTFSKASGIQFACNVPGHYQAGMVGNVEIVD
ncbi:MULTISPECIES: cupredoxin family protein [unclassified Pseudomonas]|uniref:cupredoxin domain-containing protein n=1 Tax=unclassified Pseudomonas TaxID=196821 RepID=UPI002AC89899|nr:MULTISPECIES: cupredoxin family protein [unclassified Pseudomonas]MEB0040903.1 cupredoxin family protein [Pseudomonas sp. MH10]MEB0120951.1 cupredoxin family protein [Pseudomonas sp. CCI1.2]WPX64391.1 cupredoxin family protein [Pseudomonas sp. MH10]